MRNPIPQIPRSALAALFGACLLTLAATAHAGSGGAAKAGWTTDFSAAQKKAADTGKPMLLDFTGSDWCPPCKMLNKQVFSKPAFLDYAAKNLVLVKLDFPNNKPQPEAVKKQNRRLLKEYEVSGFPTIILLSPDGKVVDRRSGYRGAGAGEYVKRLKNVVSKI